MFCAQVGGLGLVRCFGGVGTGLVGWASVGGFGLPARRNVTPLRWLGGHRAAGGSAAPKGDGVGGGAGLVSGSGLEVLGLLARHDVAPLRRLGGCCAVGAGLGEGRGL